MTQRIVKWVGPAPTRCDEDWCIAIAAIAIAAMCGAAMLLI